MSHTALESDVITQPDILTEQRTAEAESGGGVVLHQLVSNHGRTHLDLFSGIGGFALAARWTGWNTIALSEIEPYACRILAKNFPAVPNLGDIRNVRGIKCDLITGGFPCQPYSVTGKRNGNADHRALWPEMLRVIRESKPSWVLGENVSGIVSMELDKICVDLEAEGYEVQPLLIPACAADAPHERMRCWILADATGARGQSKPGGVCQDAGQEGTQANGHQQPIRGCKDGGRPREWRPEPGMGRMADGIPNRVDRLRGLGNAIVPQVAAEILRNLVMANDQALRRRADELEMQTETRTRRSLERRG